jgi:hypothetical protein
MDEKTCKHLRPMSKSPEMAICAFKERLTGEDKLLQQEVIDAKAREASIDVPFPSSYHDFCPFYEFGRGSCMWWK